MLPQLWHDISTKMAAVEKFVATASIVIDGKAPPFLRVSALFYAFSELEMVFEELQFLKVPYQHHVDIIQHNTICFLIIHFIVPPRKRYINFSFRLQNVNL